MRWQKIFMFLAGLISGFTFMYHMNYWYEYSVCYPEIRTVLSDYPYHRLTINRTARACITLFTRFTAKYNDT